MSPPKRRETGILVSLFMRFSLFKWQQLLTSVVKQLPRLNRLPADQMEISQPRVKSPTYCIGRNVVSTVLHTNRRI